MEREFSVESLIEHGQVISSNKNEGIESILRKAFKKAGDTGIIATMPYLVAGISINDNSNSVLEQPNLVSYSEENIIIDREKTLTDSGRAILLCIHGGGLLTLDRISKLNKADLTHNDSVKYSEEESVEILKGKLPHGDRIKLYPVDDVLNEKISNPFGRYGVWMEFKEARQWGSGFYTENDFMNNSIVHARVGSLEYLENYFKKISYSQFSNRVACSHYFRNIDPRQSQGNFLEISNYGISNCFRNINFPKFVVVK